MGCLMIVVSAVLALVVPASIARTSLVGAYVVIVALVVAAVTGVVLRARRTRPAVGPSPSRTGPVAGIGALAALYVAAVTIIHVTR
ncbi:MAG TPA: hypothetical protein VGN18_06640 [Jatrophihabitans sp.]|jgi:cytochrome b subunit of formate dehydrogenase|uniref:hypothetical protein n=1 Tax=Jatrophihabitans sp. TaxID=1932789 RepID=UPI002DFA5D81|nr:hypothetical protein [Jatrophihabitans sp.]